VPIELPDMPLRVARLPKDHRGYPVPWFVCWFKDGKPSRTGTGEPDFRVITPGRLVKAHRERLCWICGEEIERGRPQVYVIGPMCVVNRVTSEPASHRDCATYAVKACPFLTNPRQKRDMKDMIENPVVAGKFIPRNPGATALYQTSKVEAFAAGEGVLFGLGEPERIDWWARGRQATRAEIMESINSGFPILQEEAEREGEEAVDALRKMRRAAMKLLPAA
jgi:hypothetical protein